MTVYATRLTNDTDTAPRLRVADTLTVAAAGRLQGRGGLRPDSGGVVSAVAGSMSVQVTPFVAWVDGRASVAQGGYVFVSDATETLTVEPGDASLERIDTVCAVVYDDDHDGSGQTQPQLEVVKGTPGAGAPTLTSAHEPLRDVVVPAGTSAGTGGLSSSNMGTDRRRYTAALGGVVSVSGVAERDAMGAQVGQPVFRRDTGRVQVLTSAGWRTVVFSESATFDSLTVGGRAATKVPLVDGGVRTISNVSPGQTKSVSVSFGVDFPSAPAVSITQVGTSPENAQVSVNNVTADGCDLYLRRAASLSATVDHVVHWTAVVA